LIACLLFGSCTVGPDYSPESAPVPAKFKELKGWKVAVPSDGLDRGEWWAPYRDRKLDTLLRQVEISNQTVAAQAAAYEQARALIRTAQSALFPTLDGSYRFTRTRTGPLAGADTGTVSSPSSPSTSGSTSPPSNSTVVSSPSPGGSSGAVYSTTYIPQLQGAWDLDVWGKVRRQVESNTAFAQANYADLDNAKLSAQSQLALAYFNLRAADSLRDLLNRTAAEYKRTLEITQNQFNAGTVSRADVITAQTQLLNVQAQAINVGVQRAQFEHSIAMLIGEPPANLTIAPRTLGDRIPRIPVVLPSRLLERRPDIAAAERIMQQENALIGVAIAGFFPDISLSGLLQFIGRTPLPISAPYEVWSLGAAAAQPLFDGGLRSSQVDVSRATYWQSVAKYRQTVLTAFQQVEDELSTIRTLLQQLDIERQAVKGAREAVEIYLNQYRAGTVPFTTVVTAEAILLTLEQAELTIRQNLFLSSVRLIEALGGGWDATKLPTQSELKKTFSLLPQL
jgi:NodT family efflux transporter outer membrane factor (OMF) lipoprotein